MTVGLACRAGAPSSRRAARPEAATAVPPRACGYESARTRREGAERAEHPKTGGVVNSFHPWRWDRRKRCWDGRLHLCRGARAQASRVPAHTMALLVSEVRLRRILGAYNSISPCARRQRQVSDSGLNEGLLSLPELPTLGGVA